MQEHKKIEIVTSLNSEDELRTELIIPLFIKMGYQAIDNQGPNEYGTDVILRQKTKLGTDEYISIVLKKGDITNRAGSETGMTRIINDQISQAATSPFDHPEIKKNIFPNSVWLTTNGKISSNAKNIFCKTFKDQFHTSANIEYIDKIKLISLLDEYWPEFYSDRRPFLSQYSDMLKNELIGLNVSDVGESDKSIDSILIPQLLNEQKDFSEGASRKINVKKLPLTPIQLLNANSSVVFITGEAGSGKSTLLKRLAIDVAEKGKYSPIVVNARKLATGKISIDTIFESAFVDRDPSQLEGIKKELQQERIILLIDALDEISNLDTRKKVLEFLIQLSGDSGNIIEKVIVSTRAESNGEILSISRKFKSYQVMPVEARQINTFFVKWFGSKNKSKANSLFNELTRKSIFDRLPKTPLTLTLLAILYETKGDVPTTLTELYRMFSDLLLGKWDNKKGINTLKNSQIKFGLLSYVAWVMHEDGVGTISQAKLLEVTQHFLTRKLGDTKTDSKELIQNIT